MTLPRSRAVLCALVAAAACARPVPVAGTTEPEAAFADRARWSATLRSPSMSSTSVLYSGGTTPAAQAAGYGSAVLTPLADAAGRVRYEISVTMPSAAGTQVAWALHTGSCSTPSPPVVPTPQLPPVDLGSDGTGVVRGSIAAVLERRTTYNVRVYSRNRASDTDDVALCSKLSYSGPR